MACIDCGLGLNADGKGRVDVDTVGGLKCTGGAGGTSNASGRGLAIKLDPAAGNSATTGSAGLYVPRKFTQSIVTNYYNGGAMTDPVSGTTPSGEAAITLTNPTGSGHNMGWLVSGEVRLAGNVLADLTHIDLQVKYNDDVWQTPHTAYLPAGSGLNPYTYGMVPVYVTPGTSLTVRHRFQLYSGNITSYIVGIYAIGGFVD